MPQLTPAFLDSVHHDGSSRYVRARAGAALRLGDKVTLRLRAADPAQDWCLVHLR